MKSYKIGLIILLVVLFFSINANAEIYFVVTENINLYENPGENIIGEISKGYYFSQSYVEEQQDHWFKIKFGDQIGWVHSCHVQDEI